ncbi:MAG: hypothetical protein COA50_12800 [Flavobacteriaceae bacterium]|nr:MAG: hypothetical protein COA50_12800 [Flavobacteriaceae bacterium]
MLFIQTYYRMKIYAFHLLNDYSGSPKVLMQLVKGWIKNDISVHLVTSSGRNGFLSNIPGTTYHYFWYKWAANPVLRLCNLILSQILLFFTLYSKVTKEDIIYVNTILPFGAAFLGKLKGCKIVYHIHETTVKPAIFKKFVFGIAKLMANDVIYVSKFLSKQEHFKSSKVHVLYNAIEQKYLEKAIENRRKTITPCKVLMVCSLKKYKGVQEYLSLAEDNPQYQFRLVLNASKEDIAVFFTNNSLSSNIKIYDTQLDLHPFYKWADVILNLSRPDGWVETFGLTIIEGMAYGLPAIVPPVGGITELVVENKNGFLVDCRDRALLNKKLNQLLENKKTYSKMTAVSIEKINAFSEELFVQNSLAILSA